MPNWKKLMTSGSSGSLANLEVDNAITASNLNITSTGSFDRVEANTIDLDRLSLTSTQTTVPPLQLTANSLQDGVGALRIDGSQADIFLNPSTATHTTVTFAVNNDQRLAFGMDNNSDFYITRRTGGTWYDDTLVLDRDTGEVTLGYGLSVTGGITGSSFTGSFVGDGSGLTGVTTNLTEEVTVSQTFTSATTASVSHLFGTKNVIVTVYDENDDVFIPSRINTPDTNTAVVYMDPATTGRVVVAKGGHLVSGSLYKELITGTTSSIITHNLQEEFPIVQLYESASKEIFIPETIKSIDLNNTEITLSELLDCYVVVKR